MKGMLVFFGAVFAQKTVPAAFLARILLFIGKRQKKSGVFELFRGTICLPQALMRGFAGDALIDVDKV